MWENFAIEYENDGNYFVRREKDVNSCHVFLSCDDDGKLKTCQNKSENEKWRFRKTTKGFLIFTSRLISISVNHLKLPLVLGTNHWHAHDDTCNYLTRDIYDTAHVAGILNEEAQVLKEYVESNNSAIQVQKISRIQNKYLKKVFMNQKEQLEMKNGSPCNVLWLYNGSKVNNEAFGFSQIGMNNNIY